MNCFAWSFLEEMSLYEDRYVLHPKETVGDETCPQDPSVDEAIMPSAQILIWSHTLVRASSY